MKVHLSQSRSYNLRMAILFGGLLLLLNPFTLRFGIDYFLGWYQTTQLQPERGSLFALHRLDLKEALLSLFSTPAILISLFLAAGLCILLFSKKSLRTHVGFRAGSAGIGFVFAVIYYVAQNTYFVGRFRELRLVMVLFMGWLLVQTFYWGVIQNPKAGNLLKNAASSLFGILLLCILGEGIFLFVAESNENNSTLASKVWFARYWELNEWGYRDATMREKLEAPEKKILLLGDSFTAGHGIKNPEARFSDLLDEQLKNWRVINLGKNGSEPDDELERFKEWEGGGDLLVFVWFVNDIHEAAAAAWVSWESCIPHLEMAKYTEWTFSYFFNYLVTIYPGNSNAGNHYREFLEAAYSRQEVLDAHHEQLNSIIQLAKSRGMPTAVVLFPFMNDVDGSEFAIRPVREMLIKDSIPVLDLRPILMEKGPKNGSVGALDAHPNEIVHAIVAREMATFLSKEKLLYDEP